jgi:hypothetical protein
MTKDNTWKTQVMMVIGGMEPGTRFTSDDLHDEVAALGIAVPASKSRYGKSSASVSVGMVMQRAVAMGLIYKTKWRTRTRKMRPSLKWDTNRSAFIYRRTHKSMADIPIPENVKKEATRELATKLLEVLGGSPPAE